MGADDGLRSPAAGQDQVSVRSRRHETNSSWAAVAIGRALSFEFDRADGRSALGSCDALGRWRVLLNG